MVKASWKALGDLREGSCLAGYCYGIGYFAENGTIRASIDVNAIGI